MPTENSIVASKEAAPSTTDIIERYLLRTLYDRTADMPAATKVTRETRLCRRGDECNARVKPTPIAPSPVIITETWIALFSFRPRREATRISSPSRITELLKISAEGC